MDRTATEPRTRRSRVLAAGIVTIAAGFAACGELDDPGTGGASADAGVVRDAQAIAREPTRSLEVRTAARGKDLQASARAGAFNYYLAMPAGEDTRGTHATLAGPHARTLFDDLSLRVTSGTRPAAPDHAKADTNADTKPCAGAARPLVEPTAPTRRRHVRLPDSDRLDVVYAYGR